MRTFPKWATPERRAWLAHKLGITLAKDMAGFQVDMMSGEVFHPYYDWVEDLLIAGWKEDDREERVALRRREQEYLHPRDRIRQGGRFDSIARDVFLANQPTHYVEAVGMDVICCQPVAKVRLASSPVRLWVDIPPLDGEIPPAPEGGWSKNAMRRYRRYGKGPIAAAISQAVSDYQNSPA